MNEHIQHLQEQLHYLTDPILRIDLLNRLAFALRHTDTAQSLLNSKEAVVQADRIGYLRGLATGLLNQGFSEMVQSRYDLALSILTNAIDLFESLQDELGKARALYTRGVVYIRIGDYAKALEVHQQSLRIRQSLNDQQGESDCLAQLGYINEQFNKPLEAEKNYVQSLAIRRILNDQLGIAAVLLGLGRLNQKRQAYNQAKTYLLESLTIRKAQGEVHGWLASMHAMSDLYVEQNLLQEAENYLVQALTFAQQQAEPYAPGLCRLGINLAKVYMRTKRVETAIDSLLQALKTAQETGQKYLIHDIYFTLAEAYKLKGDYQNALTSYEQYHLQHQEVISLDVNGKLKNLELINQIEAEKKEAEIHKLRHIDLKKAYDQLHRAQQQLIQSEKMAYFGQLTAGIAHEIQNPLNFVNNFAEVSRELLEDLQNEQAKSVPDPEFITELVDDLGQNLAKIVHHGSRASSIVKSMLEHARSSTGEREPTDINALVGEHLTLAYHSFRAKEKSFTCNLVTTYAPELSLIDVVATDIGRVLLNIYNNAFYAMREREKQNNGSYQAQLVVKTEKTETSIDIQVSDNGNGISEWLQEKIFQPFFTTKPTGEGTGLGLSLSYDIITKGHQGALLVTSQEGEGTAFTIQLPVWTCNSLLEIFLRQPLKMCKNRFPADWGYGTPGLNASGDDCTTPQYTQR